VGEAAEVLRRLGAEGGVECAAGVELLADPVALGVVFLAAGLGLGRGALDGDDLDVDADRVPLALVQLGDGLRGGCGVAVEGDRQRVAGGGAVGAGRAVARARTPRETCAMTTATPARCSTWISSGRR